MTTVYVLKSGRNTYKIGFTADPKKRFLSIKSSNHNVEMIRLYHGKTSDEKQLHKMFSEKRLHGEWFMLDQNDLIVIDEYFKGKESIEVFRGLLIDVINRKKANQGIKMASLSGIPSVNFHQIEMIELTENEINEAKLVSFSLKTLKYFKRIWINMPGATHREICLKARYSKRTTASAISILKKANRNV